MVVELSEQSIFTTENTEVLYEDGLNEDAQTILFYRRYVTSDNHR
jgi:hypothetical protein